MKIKTSWRVRHSRAGRYIFCDVTTERGYLFTMFGFVTWEDRRDPTRIIRTMQRRVNENVTAWRDVEFLLKEAHDDGK